MQHDPAAPGAKSIFFDLGIQYVSVRVRSSQPQSEIESYARREACTLIPCCGVARTWMNPARS